jgi:hypothetical protein
MYASFYSKDAFTKTREKKMLVYGKEDKFPSEVQELLTKTIRLFLGKLI